MPVYLADLLDSPTDHRPQFEILFLIHSSLYEIKEYRRVFTLRFDNEVHCDQLPKLNFLYPIIVLSFRFLPAENFSKNFTIKIRWNHTLPSSTPIDVSWGSVNLFTIKVMWCKTVQTCKTSSFIRFFWIFLQNVSLKLNSQFLLFLIQN